VSAKIIVEPTPEAKSKK
jgi:hypothetical protein